MLTTDLRHDLSNSAPKISTSQSLLFTKSGNVALRVVLSAFSGLRTCIWFMVMPNGAEVASAPTEDGKLIDIVDDYVFCRKYVRRSYESDA